MIKSVRFWRYERKSSFLVERREKEEGGGRMADGDGSEESEDVRESVNVERRVGVEGFLDILLPLNIKVRSMKKWEEKYFVSLRLSG